jgi:dCMP deaminase
MKVKPDFCRLSWDDKYMLAAIVASQRSCDPSTKVGAAICDANHKPIGDGYNGPGRGINPKQIPWEREGEPGETKYEWIIHAEDNAIDNATADTEGATMYITLQPCHECSKRIIQAGIRRVVYLDDKYKDMWFTQVALDMLSMVDIVVEKHKWSKHMKEVMKRINAMVLID